MNKLHFNFKWSLLLQNSKYTTDIMLLCSVGCSLQTGCAPVANQQRQSTEENNVRAAAQRMTIKQLMPTMEFTPSDPSIVSWCHTLQCLHSSSLMPLATVIIASSQSAQFTWIPSRTALRMYGTMEWFQRSVNHIGMSCEFIGHDMNSLGPTTEHHNHAL